MERLFAITRSSLAHWADRLIAEAGDAFPARVTAFHPGMAAHGRYNQPCPQCGAPIQRIVYAGNETNYCPHCQTGGRLLADRAFSRLLREDWPRTMEELEQHFDVRR
jgi:formamidopyrimidine-DNA glycosylase